MEINLMEMVREYVSPELFLAVPLLLFIGKQLKDSKRVDDTLIVNILMYVGIAASGLYNFAKQAPANMYEWIMLVFISVLGGCALAWSSVGVNQQWKQGKLHKINMDDLGKQEYQPQEEEVIL
ncbi:MAG: phage holin family protein [Cellulosilyticaceae bacterium]